jgi:diguanylate cyclase (GGDEF)-like protein
MSQTQTPDRLVLVDDDPIARLLTRAALEERGFTVEEAEDGESAVELIDSVRPDVVVLDALMPGMDGFDTCEIIRGMPQGEHLPILMLTGLDDEQSVARAYEAGATDFFIKSTQWTLLAQRIRYLLRSSRMREELSRSQAKFAKAQRIARLGTWEWDFRNQMIFLSDECFALTGSCVTSGGVPEMSFYDLVHEDDRDRFMDALRSSIVTGKLAHVEARLAVKGGGYRTMMFEAEAEVDDVGRAVKVHGVSQDITERKSAENQIRTLANYDALTGLVNRRMFSEAFATAIEHARLKGELISALFVDLDRFKHINDTLGHAMGDELLKDVAERLQASVRDGRRTGNDRSKDTVARIGGDEFTVLLTNLAAPEDAERVAERVLAAFQKPFSLAGQDCFVSASIGIAVYPRDGENAETLLRNADLAMYSVKDAGRNSVARYTSDLTSVSRERLELESALHKAIERDELLLYYQPQIDSRTLKVVGAEALMRWKRGDKLISPADFIPLAHDSGLIIPMGEWAIRTAALEAKRWIDEGYEPIAVAVNIPGSHFQKPNFVEMVRGHIADVGLPSECMELEITETLLMENLNATLPKLTELKNMGVKLSVDDFGTGYSSLNYLSRLPIQQLKIDGSFVRELHRGAQSEAIVAAIVAMAKSLNLDVIAEGVETAEQVKALNGHGCHLMQGYHYARPMPAAEFVRFRSEMRERETERRNAQLLEAYPRGMSNTGRILNLVRAG